MLPRPFQLAHPDLGNPFSLLGILLIPGPAIRPPLGPLMHKGLFELADPSRNP